MRSSPFIRLVRGVGAPVIALAATSMALDGPGAATESRRLRRSESTPERHHTRELQTGHADRRNGGAVTSGLTTDRTHSRCGQTSVGPTPFDFSDFCLRANGIEPSRLIGRPTGKGPDSALAPSPDGDHRDVRMLEHVATWDHCGKACFVTVHGVIFLDTFTTNAAGVHARRTADTYRLYEFPRTASAPGATSSTRQAAISDMRNGFFWNNPLGIGKVVHVLYTSAAFDTADGRARLAGIAARNGTDLDGTPIVKTLSELASLRRRGLVSVNATPTDGSAGPPWFMRQVLIDPRHGAIAADARLSQPVRASGQPNPGELIFSTNFDSLQRTGRFP